MKKILSLLLLAIGFNTYAQDFQFDHKLDYINAEGDKFSYYINSKDNGYVLRDSNYHQIITENYIIYFSVSFAGETNIYDILADEFDNNTAPVNLVSTGNEEIVNGFKCKKYTFNTMVASSEDRTQTTPVTYVAYIAENVLNAAAIMDKNEVLFADSIVYGKFPKGNVVKFESLNNDFYDGYMSLRLEKVTKLEKPFIVNITNQQVTKYLINHQAE